MPIWEFAISIFDLNDEPNKYRKKEGDVIAFKPYPWVDWGKKAEKNYLIILVDGLIEEEAFNLIGPLYNIKVNGVLDDKEMEIFNAHIMGKSRYKMPLDIIKSGWYPNLDISKTKDKKLNYQPLRNESVIIDTKEPVAIFYDKFRQSYKYSTIKKI